MTVTSPRVAICKPIEMRRWPPAQFRQSDDRVIHSTQRSGRLYRVLAFKVPRGTTTVHFVEWCDNDR